MATYFTSNLAKMAASILSREGQTSTLYLVDTDASDYDPTTGLNTPSTPTSYSVKTIFLDFAILANGKQTTKGDLIEKDDKQVYLSATSNTGTSFARKPSPAGDYIVDVNGKKWRIMLVKEYNVDGVNTIMYDLLVRK